MYESCSIGGDGAAAAGAGEFFLEPLCKGHYACANADFGSGHRGVVTRDYDLNLDPEAAAILIMGFA